MGWSGWNHGTCCGCLGAGAKLLSIDCFSGFNLVCRWIDLFTCKHVFMFTMFLTSSSVLSVSCTMQSCGVIHGRASPRVDRILSRRVSFACLKVQLARPPLRFLLLTSEDESTALRDHDWHPTSGAKRETSARGRWGRATAFPRRTSCINYTLALAPPSSDHVLAAGNGEGLLSASVCTPRSVGVGLQAGIEAMVKTPEIHGNLTNSDCSLRSFRVSQIIYRNVKPPCLEAPNKVRHISSQRRTHQE